MGDEYVDYGSVELVVGMVINGIVPPWIITRLCMYWAIALSASVYM